MERKIWNSGAFNRWNSNFYKIFLSWIRDDRITFGIHFSDFLFNFGSFKGWQFDDYYKMVHGLFKNTNRRQNKGIYDSNLLIKWSAFYGWSFRPNFAWGSIRKMTIGKTHPTLLHDIWSRSWDYSWDSCAKLLFLQQINLKINWNQFGIFQFDEPWHQNASSRKK